MALAANAATGHFSILIAALQAANPDILKKLSSDREYTVFVPTDANGRTADIIGVDIQASR